MVLTRDWQTFTGKVTLTKSNNNDNSTYQVWIPLTNNSGRDISFDIANISFKDASGAEQIVEPLKTNGDSNNDTYLQKSGWAFKRWDGTEYCDIANTKIHTVTSRTEKLNFGLRNYYGVHGLGGSGLPLTNVETGAVSNKIILTNEWKTYTTEVEIYPDSQKNKLSDYLNYLCESYEGNGNYSVWLTFRDETNEITNVNTNVNNEVGVSFDVADFVLVNQATGIDRIGSKTVNSPRTGSYLTKTEQQNCFAGTYTYTYAGEGKAIDAGMYALEAKLVTDEQIGTSVEAVVTYIDTNGNEKTEIINTNDGAKSALVTRAWGNLSFIFSADEAVTLKSVALRKADASNTANVRFEDVSFKGISEFGENKSDEKLVARLDTDFGATVVTPEDIGNKYLTVYDRLSAADGIKVDFSRLDLTESASYTLEFYVRSSVKFSNIAMNHDPSECLWGHNNEVTEVSAIRIMPKNVATNYGTSWTSPVRFTLTGAELKSMASIVGGGNTAFTNPFDIDNITIKDASGKAVWSLGFEKCITENLSDDWNISATGEAGTASISAAKNKGGKYAITGSDVFYSKNISDGVISYTGDEFELEPGIYTLKGVFRNAAYISSAAELRGHNNPANGPYTTHIAKTEAIEDNNNFSLYAAVRSTDDSYVLPTSKKDITSAWTSYSFVFMVKESTKLTDIAFFAEHAVDGNTVDIDYKNIALYWSPITDKGDRPDPGIAMMLLLKMKQGSYVKTVKNDYVEVRNLTAKGFEYSLWRDAANPIDLGTYTFTVKLRGAVGGEQLKLRVRNAYYPMMNVDTGSISETVTLTDEYTVFTATVPVTEESFNGNGRDYHVWLTFDKVGAGSVSFDIDDLSFTLNGKEYIVDGLKRKDAANEDSYVQRSGWMTGDTGCTFSTVTERVERDTGKPIGG